MKVLIIIHRVEALSMRLDKKWLCSQLVKELPFDVEVREDVHSITVGENIRIEFRCGKAYKLDGLRPNYYNVDSLEAAEYLAQSAVKCNGKEILGFGTIPGIVMEEMKKGEKE